MALCRHCAKAQYHDYKDQHGTRCPLCGEKEIQAKPVDVTPPAKKAAAPTRRSK
jgi:DNA-directed RNA polymerase subunit RPC12/RpoP